MHKAAASALQVTVDGACSHTSQIHTRAWRDASLLAAWILESQGKHKKAMSALQNRVDGVVLHASQRFAVDIVVAAVVSFCFSSVFLSLSH